MSQWWLRLMRHARPPARSLAGVAVLIAVGCAFDALKPWPIKLLVDRVLQRGDGAAPGHGWLELLPGAPSTSALIAWLAAAGVLLFCFAQLVRVARSYVQAGLGSRITYTLGAELLQRMQELSLIFHNRHRVGDLVRRVVTDSGCVRDLYCGLMIPAAAAVTSLGVMFVIMFRLDPALSLIAIGFTAPLAILIWLNSRPMAQRAYEQQQREGELQSMAEQTLSSIPVVQIFSREAEHDRQFRSLAGRTARAALLSVTSQLRFRIMTGAVTALGMSTIMYIGGAHVLQGTLTIGSLLVFVAYLASLYAPLETLAYLSMSYATAAAAARRVLEVLESGERVIEKRGARLLFVSTSARGLTISFNHVTFGYARSRPVLFDINLTVPAGQVAALVGPSGAGKSTLASLVLRLFDPWEGRVRLDGQDVRDLKLTALRQQIAIVSQEPLLLPLSVAENIAYGRPGATLDQIRQVAEIAGAAEFIERMPQGYQTVLGERGLTLSAGQKQRLSIARALLKDSAVLILDEPTSALDAQTERSVVDALARLMKGRTCLIIAHRLSTIHYADAIVVLEHGRIVQHGSHEQLIARTGIYHRLYELQVGPTLAVGA